MMMSPESTSSTLHNLHSQRGPRSSHQQALPQKGTMRWPSMLRVARPCCSLAQPLLSAKLPSVPVRRGSGTERTGPKNSHQQVLLLGHGHPWPSMRADPKLSCSEVRVGLPRQPSSTTHGSGTERTGRRRLPQASPQLSTVTCLYTIQYTMRWSCLVCRLVHGSGTERTGPRSSHQQALLLGSIRRWPSMLRVARPCCSGGMAFLPEQALMIPGSGMDRTGHSTSPRPVHLVVTWLV